MADAFTTLVLPTIRVRAARSETERAIQEAKGLLRLWDFQATSGGSAHTPPIYIVRLGYPIGDDSCIQAQPPWGRRSEGSSLIASNVHIV